MRLHDLQFALRTLRRSPGFTTVAVLILAVGIGANTAMFTVVDGVLLKPLRYPDASRIVAINTHWKNTGKETPRTTGGDLMDLRHETQPFEAFSYYHGGEIGVQLPTTAEFVGTYEVDPEFFRVFNIRPVAGRLFNPDDSGRSAAIATAFAERNFGSAQGALGQMLRIEGAPYQIVAVMPSWFSFPRTAQVWAAVSPAPSNQNRSGYNYYSVAKLRPGVSLDAANAGLSTLAARLEAAFPRDNRQKTFVVSPIQDQLVSPVKTTLYILMGAVGLVLLIACANVANLMLARATARGRELAVRAALGAPRRRLIMQLLAESVVLAMLACALGLLLADWGTRGILRVSARFLPPVRLGDIHLDWRVLAFAALAALATSLIFGLAPAWQASRVDLHYALKQGGGRGLLGGGASRLRSVLVVAQIALSLVLAVGAGLLFRTFLSLNTAELGYRTEGVLVTYAHAPANGTPELIRAGQFFDDLLARLRTLPGVSSAAGAMGLPAGQYDSNGSFAIEGKQSFNDDWHKLPYAGFRLSSPGYFSTMGIPLTRGRDFNDGDVYDRPPVVIISQELAKQNFPGEDPIGHRIVCGLDLDTMKGMTVVGVVGDVRQYSPASTPAPELYMPLRQHPGPGNEVEVVTRTSGDPAALIPAVQSTIRAMNPEVAMKFTTMNDLVSDSVSAPRFRTVLAISFAGLALLLALSGMYAVMSYVTARRIPEFGLRVALGATPGNIVGLVLGRAVRLALAGALTGLALSLAASRVLSSVLFGLKSTDASTYVLVLLAVFPVIVLAAVAPAMRAARVNPMVALHDE
ncbi:MAG TPA: ABC transporter permease [Verrucomicrobiae bacterium]|jgi:putative ABC transport system permease protein|nr:ABC transporter permease [Verrucomicrobiae bacterium]